MNAITTTARKAAILAVTLTIAAAALTVPAGEAYAQILTIGATVSDTSNLSCTYRDGADGTGQLNTRFTGPHGQWVYYKVLVWEYVSSGWKLSHRDSSWRTVQILNTSNTVNAAPWVDVSNTYTLPHGSEFRSWLIEVETWRWTQETGFVDYNKEIADSSTMYFGRLYSGFCVS